MAKDLFESEPKDLFSSEVDSKEDAEAKLKAEEKAKAQAKARAEDEAKAEAEAKAEEEAKARAEAKAKAGAKAKETEDLQALRLRRALEREKHEAEKRATEQEEIPKTAAEKQLSLVETLTRNLERIHKRI